MSLSIYESYGDLTGQRSTLEQILSILGRFSRDSLLLQCAIANYGGRVWESNITERPWDVNLRVFALLDFYYPPHISSQFKPRMTAEDPRVIFHRRQLLVLQKLILQHSPASGSDIGRQRYTFGALLLMINDHLHPEKTS